MVIDLSSRKWLSILLLPISLTPSLPSPAFPVNLKIPKVFNIEVIDIAYLIKILDKLQIEIDKSKKKPLYFLLTKA